MACDESHADQVAGDRETPVKRLEAELLARSAEIHELRAANKRLGEANKNFPLRH